MKRPSGLALLALLGLAIGFAAVIRDSWVPPARRFPALAAFQPPFHSYVAGAGLVEALSGNIAIGTPVSGVVREIYVKVGDSVEKGAPLFKIDDRDLQARMLTADAQVKEAAAELQGPTHRLGYAEQLSRRDRGAVSSQHMAELRDKTDQAQAALGLAKAKLAQLQLQAQYHIVRALLDGEVLQLRMRLGELVESSASSPPMLILGGGDRLGLRVDVDEYDAWRLRPGAQAVASLPGHPRPSIKLRYEYTEPYVVPKTTLTGRGTERTDTRVLQVVYSFERPRLPVYVGQQLDVYIDAPPADQPQSRP